MAFEAMKGGQRRPKRHHLRLDPLQIQCMRHTLLCAYALDFEVAIGMPPAAAER